MFSRNIFGRWLDRPPRPAEPASAPAPGPVPEPAAPIVASAPTAPERRESPLAGVCGSLHACLDLEEGAIEDLSETLGAVVETLGLIDQVREGAGKILTTIGQEGDDTGLTAALAAAGAKVHTTRDLLERGVGGLREFENHMGSLLEINATIDDLADRSNILALNASIEAARAGHAGRAFQVVAKEMQDLARKNAELTRRSEAVVTQVRGGAARMAAEFDQALQTVGVALEWMERQAGASLAEVAGAAREIDRLAEEEVESGSSMAEKLAKVRKVLGDLGGAIGEVCEMVKPMPAEATHD